MTEKDGRSRATYTPGKAGRMPGPCPIRTKLVNQILKRLEAERAADDRQTWAGYGSTHPVLEVHPVNPLEASTPGKPLVYEAGYQAR